MSWKDKVKYSCKCFCGEDNSIGLINNKDVCDCNANDFKLALLSDKHQTQISIAKALIKLGLLTRVECMECLVDLCNSGKGSDHLYNLARKQLKKEEFHIFYDKQRIVHAYDKNKI
jgi:hypothetical protein